MTMAEDSAVRGEPGTNGVNGTANDEGVINSDGVIVVSGMIPELSGLLAELTFRSGPVQSGSSSPSGWPKRAFLPRSSKCYPMSSNPHELPSTTPSLSGSSIVQGFSKTALKEGAQRQMCVG